MEDISQQTAAAMKTATRSQRHPTVKSTCKRLPVTATVEQRREAHRAKMLSKRRRDAELGTGFMPIANKRVDAAIGVAELGITVENLKAGLTQSASEIQERALRRVAGQLPAPRRVRPVRFRPTKNDDPAYRNGGVGTAAERRWVAVGAVS